MLGSRAECSYWYRAAAGTANSATVHTHGAIVVAIHCWRSHTCPTTSSPSNLGSWLGASDAVGPGGTCSPSLAGSSSTSSRYSSCLPVVLAVPTACRSCCCAKDCSRSASCCYTASNCCAISARTAALVEYCSDREDS